MIEFSNVYKYYKTDGHRNVILDHVTTTFERGYSYGLLGVNGAGKSTTMRLIAGTEYPNSGSIKRSVQLSWPLGFASAFNPLMTGRHNAAFAARVYGQNVRRALDFVEDFF